MCVPVPLLQYKYRNFVVFVTVLQAITHTLTYKNLRLKCIGCYVLLFATYEVRFDRILRS